MFPESLGWRTLTGQPNDPPPPMYDPFASLIADYLPGSDIDRGGLEGTVRFRHASRMRATFFRVPSLLSPLPPLSCPLSRHASRILVHEAAGYLTVGQTVLRIRAR